MQRIFVLDLPSFLMIIDDDTWVNPWILSEFIQKLDATDRIFTGDIMHARDLHGHGDRYVPITY